MSWQFVFNSRFLLGGTKIEDVAKLCHVCKYDFFAFNGEVYFITPDGTEWIETKITVEDLY